MSAPYAEMALEWIRVNQSLPQPSSSGKGLIGIAADALFSLVNKAHPNAMLLRVGHHLVQHTGLLSARLSVRQVQSLHFARTTLFPYAEGYVLLDAGDEW